MQLPDKGNTPPSPFRCAVSSGPGRQVRPTRRPGTWRDSMWGAIRFIAEQRLPRGSMSVYDRPGTLRTAGMLRG